MASGFETGKRAPDLDIKLLNGKTTREFWKGKNHIFPSAMRSDATFPHYGRIVTTPTYFIIDREGVVRQRINGSPEPGAITQLVASLL